MQFSVIALLSLGALALGNPTPNTGLKVRQAQAAAGGAAAGGAAAGAGAAAPAAGQSANGGPKVQTSAMTDQSGKVVTFDSTKVYLAGQDAGL